MPVESKQARTNAIYFLQEAGVKVEGSAHTETRDRVDWWLVLVQLARNTDNWATVGVYTNGMLVGIKSGHHPNITLEELKKSKYE